MAEAPGAELRDFKGFKELKHQRTEAAQGLSSIEEPLDMIRHRTRCCGAQISTGVKGILNS